MASDLLDAWRMAQEVNLFLVDHVPAAGWTAQYAPRTRDVRAQFVHLHNVRLRWLNHAAPEHVGDAAPIGKDDAPTKAQLKKALKASGKAIERFLAASEEAGKVKGWKGGPATFLGYLVAHEAHHRGLVGVALRTAGHKLPDEAIYGQWDWGKRASRRG